MRDAKLKLDDVGVTRLNDGVKCGIDVCLSFMIRLL